MMSSDFISNTISKHSDTDKTTHKANKGIKMRCVLYFNIYELLSPPVHCEAL